MPICVNNNTTPFIMIIFPLLSIICPLALYLGPFRRSVFHHPPHP